MKKKDNHGSGMSTAEWRNSHIEHIKAREKNPLLGEKPSVKASLSFVNHGFGRFSTGQSLREDASSQDCGDRPGQAEGNAVQRVAGTHHQVKAPGKGTSSKEDPKTPTLSDEEDWDPIEGGLPRDPEAHFRINQLEQMMQQMMIQVQCLTQAVQQGMKPSEQWVPIFVNFWQCVIMKFRVISFVRGITIDIMGINIINQPIG